MLVPAMVIITLALVLYTIGVWGERIQGILKWWHVVFFGLGLAADATGTFLMTQIAGNRRDEGITAGGLSTLMAVSGTIVILLMAVHLIWAVVVLLRNRDDEKLVFHRFSVGVWALWLIPYIAGAAVAMTGSWATRRGDRRVRSPEPSACCVAARPPHGAPATRNATEVSHQGGVTVRLVRWSGRVGDLLVFGDR